MKLRRSTQDPIAIALVDAGVSADVARRLASEGTALHIKPGVPLCREGDIGREAFVLVSGEAVVVQGDDDVRTLSAGEVFGEIAALDPKRLRNATVETTEPSVVLAYDVRTFRRLAQEIDVLTPERAA